MSSIRMIIVAICALLLGILGQNAFASDNGVFKLELPDAVAVGMGGAFVGESDRPSAVYYDPAGMTQMDTAEVSAGLTMVQPQIKFESLIPNNGNTSEMNRINYLFPDVFVTMPLIKDKLYLGIGESSDFGGGNSWAADSFSQYATIKDSLENQDYRIAAAYKINDQWSFGAEAISDQSKFEHDQGINQGTGTNVDAFFKANDDAWGFDVGGMFKLNEMNQFGLNYKSPIQHTYDGTLYLNNLSPFSLGSPGFFNGTSFSTRAIQKLTLPQSVTLGYSFKPTHKWTFNFDLEWTDWSQYKRQTVFYPNVTSPGQLAILSTGNPQARDWNSVWSESLGVQYAVTDKFRVRGGYSHHQSPVPKATFDTEFPDGDSNSITAGMGYDITSRLSLDIAYVAAFYQPRNVINTVDNVYGAFLSGKYSEFVNIGTISLTYKF